MTDIVSVPRTDIVQSGFLSRTEIVLKEVVDSKDFEGGFQFVKDLYTMGQTFDDAIGIVLSGMAEIWLPEEHDGEQFEQAAKRITGLEIVTVQRHIKIQKALPVIPEDYREEIQNKGFKAKIRVAQLVEGGYEMTDENWRDIAEAPDEKEVDRISRSIRKVEPRSNWLAISIDSNGVLNVHTVRGVREVGRLNTWDDNPDVQKAISRLTSCTGVQPAKEY